MGLRKLLMMLIFCAITIGCLGCEGNEPSAKDWHTLDKIINTFEKEGMNLEPNSTQSPSIFELKEIKPAIFKINKTNDDLLVYIFDFFVDEKEVDKLYFFDEQNRPENIPFVSKNTVIIYMPSEMPKDDQSIKHFNETGNKIADIIFKNLNDGKEVIFKDESTHWEAKVTLKYFENQWKDEKGESHFQDFHTERHEIRYKMTDIKSVGPIHYEYESPGPSETVHNLILDRDGSATAIRNGSSSHIDLNNRYYHVTIRWNGKEENLDLKLHN